MSRGEPEGLLARFRGGLARTREVLNTPVEDVFRGRRPLDPAQLDAIEEALIAADLGVTAATEAIETLRRRSAEVASGGPEAMRRLLRDEVVAALERPAPGPEPFRVRPWVVFVVGVNGVGKTTTIGKLAAAWGAQGRSTLMCAADTFRAAAADQLAIWSERVGQPIQRGAEGADPASVVTDALRSARSRRLDAVLVDTAGRLHTRGNLMAELEKMARVAGREVPGAPHETLLVLDASVGSNGLAQAREFARVAPLSGVVLTKLDGTARGGIAVAVVRELGIPIRYVGIGEAADDLVPFDARSFATALIDPGP